MILSADVALCSSTAEAAMIDAALLAKQYAGVGSVVADKLVVLATGVIESLARAAQNAAVPVAGDRIAIRVASSVAQDTSLAVTDRKYFHFLISVGGCIVPIQPTDLEGHLWNYRE